jgi:hypothetical protein
VLFFIKSEKDFDAEQNFRRQNASWKKTNASIENSKCGKKGLRRGREGGIAELEVFV